ncbi:MAG: single-stranded DNA-binding protein [Candidatus Sungbacteria bacterium]|nr:single-stranded DNA-binding protein [Candidatus Sungbacteria bacterium]
MNLNKVFLFGNLTRDPELRQTPNGQAVCTFGIATNRSFNNAAGQRQEQVEFHNIVAWARSAEIIAQYMKKGSSMFIEGRLQTRSWDDQSGAKHTRTEIVVDEFQFGPRPAGMGGGSAPLSTGRMSSEQGAPRSGSGQQGEGYNQSAPTDQHEQKSPAEDTTPIIELPGDEQEIDVKDIPF